MPDLKRWLSSPRTSESDSQREERRPEDEEQSLFCESLFALMQRTGRFDYLDYSSKDTSRGKEGKVEAADAEKEKEKERQKDLPRSLNRFSWSR